MSLAFNQTLKFITKTKLDELQKRRLAYQVHANILQEANKAPNDLAKVEILLKAVRSWTGPGAVIGSRTAGAKIDLSNLDLWILQAKRDPGFPPDLLKNWANILETHIRHTQRKFDYAKLFGELMNEWLSSGDSSVPSAPTKNSGESFVVVPGRKELFEQQDRLVSIIFEPKSIDTAALKSYLTELFEGDNAVKELKCIRVAIEQFSEHLQQKTITAADLRLAIRDLLASALLNEDNRTILREFLENQTILEEVANVLTLRLASLDTWSWPASGVTVEMRRHINGKYRAFTDSEFLDAIFLHYLGVAWQVKFKQIFRGLIASEIWKLSCPPVSNVENHRRTQYFDESADDLTIERTRVSARYTITLSQLSDSAGSTPVYDDLLDDTMGGRQDVSAAMIKKNLLHLMVDECQLNKTIHGSHALLRSDLEWFGPSLSHDLILTVFSFFGVPDRWLKFFETFLRAPLRFKDDPSGQLRIRQRGTPISHSLSVVCGEVILFCMDFAVNQRADGLFLYRMHDDLWLWDAKPEKVAAGWREMNRFASLAALTFNTSKTGSACVGEVSDADLPPGDVRWGFLKFEPEKGRFVIDQQDVDREIIELRRQLGSTQSVFGWINAYNKYMGYFFRNFGGRPAESFGRAHADDMIDTLGRIQRELFPSSDGGVVGHLRDMIADRFGVRDLPHGCFYLPVESGGLEVRNPLIELFALREAIVSDPEDTFRREITQDSQIYRSMKEKWESSRAGQDAYANAGVQFPTFEEYVSRRETRINRWMKAYQFLRETPKLSYVKMTPTVEAALESESSIYGCWDDMDHDIQWVVSLYGDELVNEFGSLAVVDPTLIPVGIVQLFRASRMRLDQ